MQSSIEFGLYVAPFDSAFIVVAVVNVATYEQQQQHSTQN